MIRWVNLSLSAALLVALGLAWARDRAAPWRAHSSAPVQTSNAAGGVDRCPTCHTGTVANVLPEQPGTRDGRLHSRPGAASGSRAGTRGVRASGSHPEIPGHEDLTRTGCTPCHGGQGRRLDAGAHGPPLGGGPDPFLSSDLREARCARCHIPASLTATSRLRAGIEEYFEAGCSGCHEPGRASPGLGPDLRRLGRRSLEELRRALLAPRETYPAALMWSLESRYGPGSPDGERRLEALIVALLAISDDPEPYRSLWTTRGLPADADCESCHRSREGSPRPAAAPHRCTLIRQSPQLRCRSCHAGPAAAEAPSASGRPTTSTSRSCPQLAASRSSCNVCHLESDRQRSTCQIRAP